MLPEQAFPPSLHQVSALQGIRASVARTPRKPAIVEGGHVLTYAQLGQAIAGGGVAGAARLTGTVVSWLAAVRGQPYGVGEDDTFVLCPAPLSHRALVLRLLNISVSHPVFSRDTASAMPLALDSAAGATAAIAPLWLGGTLHLFEPGDAAGVCTAIVDGSVNQAWLGAPEFAALEGMALDCPPHANLRGVVCAGLPETAMRGRLLDWLGAGRVSAESGDDALGPVMRHPGLAWAGELYPGVMMDVDGRVSSLAADPAIPVWKGVHDASRA